MTRTYSDQASIRVKDLLERGRSGGMLADHPPPILPQFISPYHSPSSTYFPSVTLLCPL